MHPIREPALFLTLYLKRPPERSDYDLGGLEEMLTAFDDRADRVGLKPVGSTWAHSRLAEITTAPWKAERRLQRLVNRRSDDRPPSCQLIAYGYHDAIIVQVLEARFDPWTGSVSEAGTELLATAAPWLDAASQGRTRPWLLGATALLWVIGDESDDATEYSEEIDSILGMRTTPRTATDIGSLWRGTGPATKTADPPLDLWVLLTSPSDFDQREANARYNEPSADPPPFVSVALSNHKFWSQVEIFDALCPRMRRAEHLLDEASDRLLETERNHALDLAELRSTKAEDFQRNVTQMASELAEYRHLIAQGRQMYRTLRVNRTNFLVHSPALLAAKAMRELDVAADQGITAAALLQGHIHDEVFGRALGRMESAVQQVGVDLDYAEQAMARHTAIVQSGIEHMEIAGQRALGEMSGLHGLEVGTVVATVVAFIAAEMLKLGGTTSVAERWPVWAGLWIMASAIGSFTLVRLLTSIGKKKGWVERASVGLTLGLVGDLAVTAIRGEHGATVAYAALMTLALVAGTAIGIVSFRSWKGQ